jgi:hypothetical protein
METMSIEVPAMYGDHHVMEVRRLLMEAGGVVDVYASSAFRVVEIAYDPAKGSPEHYRTILDEAGYIGELPIPTEASSAAYNVVGLNSNLRHTAVYETTRQVVSFSQIVENSGKPLWPCPGVGPMKTLKLEEE